MSLARPHIGKLFLPSGAVGGYRTDLFFFRFLVKAKLKFSHLERPSTRLRKGKRLPDTSICFPRFSRYFKTTLGEYYFCVCGNVFGNIFAMFLSFCER